MNKPTPEKDEFAAYIAGQKEKGLIGFHVSRKCDIDFNSSPPKVIYESIENEEEFFAELNRMIEAPVLSDPEIFPNGLRFESSKP